MLYPFLLRHILLPTALMASRSRYLRIARETTRRQYWPRQKMEAWQQEQLTTLLDHAINHVPYYRERLGSVAGPVGWEQFSSLPILTKDDIEANFPDRIVSDSYCREDIRHVGSGGTTHRVVVLHDFIKRDYGRAGELVTSTADCEFNLGKRTASIPPDACMDLCGLDNDRESSVARRLWEMVMEKKGRDRESISDLRGLIMNNWVFRRKVLAPFGPDGTHVPG